MSLSYIINSKKNNTIFLKSINHTLMTTDSNIAFTTGIIDEKELLDIKNKNFEVQCSVYSKKNKAIFLNSTEIQAVQNCQVNLILGIYGRYIVQTDPQNLKPLSALSLDQINSFSVIRKPSEQKNKVKDPIAINLNLKQTKIVSFLIKQEHIQNLEDFCLALHKKHIIHNGFEDLFIVKQKISSGRTGAVYRASCLRTKKQVAIKALKSIFSQSEENTSQKTFPKQFKALVSVQHRNIVELQGVYQTENTLYLVMKHFSMTLGHFCYHYPLRPSIVSSIMFNLLSAVKYIASKRLIHRDLKLENIMMVEQDGKLTPKIIDFGLVEFENIDGNSFDTLGTLGYVAPETWEIKQAGGMKNLTSKSDIFSLGVVFHHLLFRSAVFSGSDRDELEKKNRQCLIDFEKQHFKLLGETGTDLLKRMLEVDPDRRISAGQALQHRYFQAQNYKYPKSVSNKQQHQK